MTDEDVAYEVIDLDPAVPNDDGSYVKFTFRMRDGPPLALALPARCLFPLAALSFTAANQAYAISGTLANQQILAAEGVEVHPDPDNVDLHFRLSGTHTDIPISLTRQAAEALSKRLSASLGPGSGPRTTRQ